MGIRGHTRTSERLSAHGGLRGRTLRHQLINDAMAPRRRLRQPSVRAVVGAGSEAPLTKTLNPQPSTRNPTRRRRQGGASEPAAPSDDDVAPESSRRCRQRDERRRPRRASSSGRPGGGARIDSSDSWVPTGGPASCPALHPRPDHMCICVCVYTYIYV